MVPAQKYGSKIDNVFLFFPSCDATRSSKDAMHWSAHKLVSIWLSLWTWKGYSIFSVAASAMEKLLFNAYVCSRRPCAHLPPRRRSAAIANIVPSCTSNSPTFRYAHTVMASACGPKSSRRSSAALPKAKKSRVSDWPTIATLANAHAVLVRSCALKSATCHSAAIANTVDSSASDWAAIAYAHAVLARS